jgi:hypothetical protein
VLLGSAVFVAIALKPVEFKLRRAKVRFSMVMGRFFRFSS